MLLIITKDCCCKGCCKGLESAIKEIEQQPGEIFSLIANWYDEEINEEKKSGGVPFANFSKIIEYLQKKQKRHFILKQQPLL